MLAKFIRYVYCCRFASVAATGAARSLADDEDNVESGSSDEAGKYGINDVDDSSV